MPVAAADVDFPLVSDHGTTETGLKHRGNLRPLVFIRLIPAIAILLSSYLKVSRGGADPPNFQSHKQKECFQQTHNEGLRQLLLTVSWDLSA